MRLPGNKQPPGAFMVFLSEYRTETGTNAKTIKECSSVASEAGQKWRALEESERQVGAQSDTLELENRC